jgi:hypothetical protein
MNEVIHKRFSTPQQMAWTPHRPHLLPQIHARVFNGKWEATFREWYPGFRASTRAMAA